MSVPKIIVNPKISPNKMSIADIGDGGIDTGEYFGQDSPFIKINGIGYFGEMIISFKLNITKLIPHVFVSLRSNDGLFNGKYPTDGDVLTVYLKSSHKDFKSILMDFRIIQINAPMSMDDRGYSSDVTIVGIMDVPDLYRNHLDSIQGNTLDVYKHICSKTGLGLVSNSQFNDDMTHICPFDDYKQFIKNVCSTAYSTDEAFFDCFIDQYYNISIIDVESVLSIGTNKSYPILKMGDYAKTDYRQDDTKASTELPMVMSNSKVFAGTINHVRGFALFNNSKSALDTGYRSYFTFRNQNDASQNEFYVDPIYQSGSNIVNRGRNDESVDDRIKYTNHGFQFDDNVHPNYYFAKEHNKINNSEIRKMGVDIKLTGMNPFFYRGMGAHVLMYDKPNQGIDNEQESQNLRNSGWYYVDGIEYSYDSINGDFNTILKLLKKEWVL